MMYIVRNKQYKKKSPRLILRSDGGLIAFDFSRRKPADTDLKSRISYYTSTSQSNSLDL